MVQFYLFVRQFSLEEEDVWRAVFRWSKHQAKVEMAVEDWTDYDRAGVCKVRLFLNVYCIHGTVSVHTTFEF